MADQKSRNIPFYWANRFLQSLTHHGVRHIIISPGSRSSPLALASAANSETEKHIILDERSAAFTGLGIGKSTGFPAALVCTSGTAGSNYLPAVIEARQAGVPLIVLTADRPPHLRDIGANQAMDQLKLFGSYPVWFHEVGEPVLEQPDIRRLQAAAQQAVYYSRRDRGPCHLNFAFRKPLEPEPAYFNEIKSKNNRKHEKETDKHFYPGNRSGVDLQSLTEQLQRCERPILIAGPEDPGYSLGSWAVQLAENFDVPILPEPGSNLPESDRNVHGFAGYLRRSSVRKKLSPDLVIRVGQQITTKALNLYLNEHRNVPHHHFTRFPSMQDAQLSTHYRYQGIPDPIRSQHKFRRGNWWTAWNKEMNHHDEKLKQIMSGSKSLTDGEVIRHLLAHLPENWASVLSNSFPIRDAALFGGKRVPDRPTFVNRGTSGIDGVTSTAAGITAGLKQPTLLLAGDLAFLHDTNALLNQSILPEPLVIAIINNGGGSIFRMLPIAEHKELFSTYFETRQQVDLSPMAKTYSVSHRKFTKDTQLEEITFETYEDTRGIHLLEFQTDPDLSMEQRKLLWSD